MLTPEVKTSEVLDSAIAPSKAEDCFGYIPVSQVDEGVIRSNMKLTEVTLFQSTDNVDFTGKFYTTTLKNELPDELENGHRVVRPQLLVFDESGSFASEQELRQAGYKRVDF